MIAGFLIGILCGGLAATPLAWGLRKGTGFQARFLAATTIVLLFLAAFGAASSLLTTGRAVFAVGLVVGVVLAQVGADRLWGGARWPRGKGSRQGP